MRVFVVSMKSEPLMPTTHRKARILLKLGKAKVVKNAPFTIQLMYATSETKQDVSIGDNSDSKVLEFSDIKEPLAARREADETISPVQTATIYELDTKRKKVATKPK